MKWKENFAIKALAFIAAVAAFAAAAIMGWYQLVNFDNLWGGQSPADSSTVCYLERQDLSDIVYLLYMYNKEALGQELSLGAAQDKLELEDQFSTDVTNLRWQARDEAGNFRYGNTRESVSIRAQGLYQDDYTWTIAVPKVQVEIGEADWLSAAEEAVNVTEPDNVIELEFWYEELMEAVGAYQYEGLEVAEDRLDTVYLSPDGTADLLTVIDEAGVHIYGPSIRNVIETNEYGYRYEGGWTQVEDMENEQTETLTVTLWLAAGLPVADQYQRAVNTLSAWTANRGLALGGTIACGVAGLLLMIYLCVVCGHKRGRDGIYLNWFHRIPGDLMAAAVLFAGGLMREIFFDRLYYSLMYAVDKTPVYWQLIFVGCLTAALAALVIGALVTFTARCKAHTLWRNTVIWRLCRLVGRICRAVPLMWKTVLAGMCYLLVGSCLLTAYRHSGDGWICILWFLITAAVIAFLGLWACQWKRIRNGTKEIVGGNPDYLIDTRRMLPDLKQHAGELNNLGQAISAAVDDRMRSERFKAELITNVSHDLKTPLTSIINYVDLLKKEHIEDPKAAEYIEVLDRKSQRLKKLTEDLVEASKASTGSLAVVRERIGLIQLADQALGEYEERLTAKRLRVVRAFPGEKVWVEADGRHLWRVLDNLLSNCAKYAMEGTRVYLEVRQFPDTAVLSMKNISRDELNVPPEALVERFVRGDESRTTEGSGLGLSIAQSLTELQSGRFEVSIDGDLFKATVTLPLAKGTGRSLDAGLDPDREPEQL